MSEHSPFVTTLDLSLSDKLHKDLVEKGFEISKPPYTVFSAKSKEVVCTLYQSGKLIVQGKGKAEFIEFYLEPEVLHTLKFRYSDLELNMTPRIGIDESGKGDFFGPLCIAGVYAGGEEIRGLHKLGVKDSKSLSDLQIRKIGKAIKQEYLHHIVKINPQKYNELYEQFKNLNSLLGWGHATTIESLVAKSNCTMVVIDQFADESIVARAVQRKKLILSLTQRHRAEEDLVVAAASILARLTFVEGLEMLSNEFGIELPKGASAKTIEAGKIFVKKLGQENLKKVCKLHFKTLDAILPS